MIHHLQILNYIKNEIAKIIKIQKKIKENNLLLNKQISQNKIYKEEKNINEKNNEELIKEIGVLEDKYSKLYLKEENKFNSKIIKTQEEYDTLRQ